MPQIEAAHGVLGPYELRALGSVFEEACHAANITRNSEEAERMALKIMLMFQSGVDDHGQLLEAAIKLPDLHEE
jgi:hypothetical protein